MEPRFHARDLFIRQFGKLALSFGFGYVAVVLVADLDEEVDQTVGHVHHFLNGSLRPVVVHQVLHLGRQFGCDGFLDELKQPFHDMGQVDVAIAGCGFVSTRDLPRSVSHIDQRKGLGESFEQVIVL